MKKNAPLKFGIISTATVNEYGFFPSVKHTKGVEAAAIASRDAEKAKKHAAMYGVPKAYGDYDALLADPDIDCVYIPLPNHLHVEWTRKALRAGKHVLCEKPFAWNEKEARSIEPIVRKTGLIFAEGFHYRYHPLTLRVLDLIRSGKIGDLLSVRISFCEIISNKAAVQFRPEYAGGAMMDMGCYGVHFARTIAGCDAAEVTRVKARMCRTGVDGETTADMLFSNGVRGTVICSILQTFPAYAVITGTRGTIFITNPISSTLYVNGKIVDQYLCLLQNGTVTKEIRVPVTEHTYASQLAAFRDAVHSGKQPLTGIGDAIANMRLIDVVRAKAGVKVPCPEKFR